MTTRAGLDHVRELMALATGDEKHDESSTSTLDALWVLYDQVLRVSPDTVGDPGRDRFLLSKGHGPAAYYAVLAAKEFFPESWLAGFGSGGSRLGSHPDRSLVDGDRLGELLDDGSGGGGEPSFPQLVLARGHRRSGYEPEAARFATSAWMRRRSAFKRMKPSATRSRSRAPPKRAAPVRTARSAAASSFIRWATKPRT